MQPAETTPCLLPLSQPGQAEPADPLTALVQLLARIDGPVNLTVRRPDYVASLVVRTGPQDVREHPCRRAILNTLAEFDCRMTLADLLDAFETAGRSWCERTLTRHVKDLMAEGLIDNNRHARPRGYGLVVPRQA